MGPFIPTFLPFRPLPPSPPYAQRADREAKLKFAYLLGMYGVSIGSCLPRRPSLSTKLKSKV
jgi:hypothetical protein